MDLIPDLIEKLVGYVHVYVLFQLLWVTSESLCVPSYGGVLAIAYFTFRAKIGGIFLINCMENGKLILDLIENPN